MVRNIGPSGHSVTGLLRIFTFNLHFQSCPSLFIHDDIATYLEEIVD